MAIPDELQQVVLKRFRLSHAGSHGPSHWERVRENGLFLARHVEGVDIAVIEAFAWLHDSCREDEGGDPAHGHRSADFVFELAASGRLQLDDSQVEDLRTACRGHSHGWVEGAATVQVCWDADRLDLGRVGTMPAAEYLCTAPARRRSVIRWAYARSVGRSAPFPRL